MDIVFSQLDDGRHSFSIKNGDDFIFSSTDECLPYLGEYGSYKTREESILSFRRFAFLNPDFVKLADESEEQKDAIKSRVIDQFNKKALVFIRLIDQLESFDDKSKLQERVDLLKGQFDQFTKSVTDTIREFEGNTGDASSIEKQDVQEIGYEEVKDPFAKDLVKLKRRIKKFYRRLRRKFGDYIKANSCEFLRKLSSIDSDFKKEIVFDFGEEIAKSLSFSNCRVGSVEIVDDGYGVLISSDDGCFSVSFNGELLMTEVLPLSKMSKSHPYMSHKYYNEIWLPVFLSVGNYMVDENHIIVPEQPSNIRIGYSNGKYLKNRFVGFDIRDSSIIDASVYVVGENSPIQKTCMLSISKKNKENEINVEMQETRSSVLSSQLVVCENSGTKYDGIAGEVHADEVKDRNGYFEVPVTFKFDTGAEETVVLPSYNLKRYA